MRINSRYGFSVIGLAAVTVVIMLLGLALIPLVSNGLSHVEAEGVGRCGRDLFVAITGANTEREPLGLPSVWPSDGVPLTYAANDIASVAFTNSTDYFNRLFDGAHMGTARWNPLVAGCDFRKLAGAGVLACTDGKLTAENNLWTVAMNVSDKTGDGIPVLVTRNIDASSLAARVTMRDWNKCLRLDPEWNMPHRGMAFVMVYKNGVVLKSRAKLRSYGRVYGKQTFDATVDRRGEPVSKPLKYLTPIRAVVPGESVYAEGAVRSKTLSADVVWRNLKRNKDVPLVACVVGVYLLAAGVCTVIRHSKRLKPCLTGYELGVGLFHFAAVMLWLCLMLDGAHEFEHGGVLLPLALLAQAGGIAFVVAGCRDDRAARQRGMKWLVAAPLIAIGSLFLMLVLGAFR